MIIFVNNPSQFDEEVISNDDGFNAELILEADLVAESIDSAIDNVLDAELVLEADINTIPYFITGIDAELVLETDLNADVVLKLVEPEPIVETVSNEDFKQSLKARLFINNVETDIRSARWSNPAENLGSILTVNLSKTGLNAVPNNAVFKFQIGEYTGAGWEWTTILENGKLDSRNLSRSWGDKRPNDTLSFSTLSPIEDRFALAPRKNIFCYDSSRTKIDITEVKTIYDTNGNPIPNEVRAFSVLSLKNLLDIAFVEICGFDYVETDILNYPILKNAFSFKQTAKDSVSPFIGNFRPHFVPLADGGLRILNGVKPIDGALLTSVEINEDDYENLSLQSRGVLSDGLTILYQSNPLYGTVTTRPKNWTEPNGGNFGDANYTETVINQIWKDYKDANGNLLDSKLISDKRTKYKNVLITEEITEEHFYNGQGLETEVRTTRRALLPSLPSGTKTLQLVKEIVKENFHKNDPFDPGRIYTAKSVQQISGLYTIDSTNKQLGENVKRDYELTADSFNLTEDMTTGTGELWTIIEDFVPIGNGQVRCYTSGTNHLTDAPIEPTSDIRAGDISINGAISEQLELVIWKDGVEPGKGLPPRDYNIGEIPLQFGIPLAEAELANQDAHKLTGGINVLGFNKNLRRGQFFKGKGRGTEDLGNYLVEGFDVTMENLGSRHKFTTILQSSQA